MDDLLVRVKLFESSIFLAVGTPPSARVGNELYSCPGSGGALEPSEKMRFSLDTWNNAKIHSDQSETYIKSTYTLGHRIFRDFNARRMRDCNHLIKSADFKQKFESSGSLSY